MLAEKNPVYEDLASKFWEHFVYIANSMNSLTDPKKSLWHEEDGFFYDHLTTPDCETIPIRARTMVGFVPLFGATAVDADSCKSPPGVQSPAAVVYRASARSGRKRRADGHARRYTTR